LKRREDLEMYSIGTNQQNGGLFVIIATVGGFEALNMHKVMVFCILILKDSIIVFNDEHFVPTVNAPGLLVDSLLILI
jgi:hypothetical protein